MQKTNTLLHADEFLKLLKTGGMASCHNPMTVRGFVTIDGEKDSMFPRLEQITFTDLVTISNFTAPDPQGGALLIQNCNFVGTLVLENINSRYISILESEMENCSFWGCRGIGADLIQVKIRRHLDVSGFNLKKYLTLNEVEFAELRLIHHSTGNRAQLALVKTDNELVAFQCRMAQIPVIIPTGLAQKMLESRMDRMIKTA